MTRAHGRRASRLAFAAALFASVGFAAGCEARGFDETDRSASPVEVREGTPAEAPATSPTPPSEELVLDTRDDGALLLGRPEPAIPHSDHQPGFVLRVIGSGGAVAQELDPALDGARVLEARFAGAGILTLGADHVLRLHAGGSATEIDSDAYGPLSVVAGHVAYVRGQPPSLEVARADLSGGVAMTLTQGMAPAWSPALTPDGRAVVFVSGAGGTPRLYRVEEGGQPRALPPIGRFPTEPAPPRFERGLYVFEDHLGTAWADLERGRIVRTAGGAP